LTKCVMWGDMMDVITCAIFQDCRLKGVGVVRGVSLPSPIDLTCRPYNTGHITVWPCDFEWKLKQTHASLSNSMQFWRYWRFMQIRQRIFNCTEMQIMDIILYKMIKLLMYYAPFYH